MWCDVVGQWSTKKENEYFSSKKSTVHERSKNNFDYHVNEVAGIDSIPIDILHFVRFTDYFIIIFHIINLGLMKFSLTY